ncbi:hypothetical protein EMIHUDRAFT_228910 [Emiliania huxleyi CCMP1516]|uniref:Ankyrin repeat protein n=2 Tax=Emiliania huxleyi TaxID=2903 RepID=A0A0D3KE70_EMIH1|nr:hypothetical protein EMIHUDRAFT_228910 [Emiliania huxleyi CCMP1516]EOD34055.1 hypothetical protein EMIHUDRAFT_228910 [Emiliania huxleyi CCMP1516]|eukprot:XP_005786484.1 hypothetical protein EMIHUDRAFT_228910 [Emiliania huxleyi CCMP1516]
MPTVLFSPFAAGSAARMFDDSSCSECFKAAHDSIDQPAIAASAAAAALGKQLRVACADRSGPTEVALAEVKRLLSVPGADVNDANRNGKAAIHHTAQLRSDTEVLACLVAHGADVNATTHRGHTPLIYAAGRCREQVVRFLLANRLSC